jgi:chemotaxis signal transduction protein
MDPALRHRATAGPVVAIVQAAGQRIGVAGAHVVQAVEVPPDMAAVPRRTGGIAGVIMRGDQLVPVLRLQDWLETPREDVGAVPAKADARIVILRSGDVVVGLLVEAVIGLRRCADDAVARLFHDDRPDELFAGAVRLDAETAPLPLLEPARLAALAGVWCKAAGVAVGSASRERPGESTVPHTSLGVFRIGDVRVGIRAADIGELLLTPVLRAPPLRQPTTRGLCDWRGRLLPVADIGVLLGARPDARAPAWMCVLRHGERVLGVLVDEIVELHGAAGADGGTAASTDDLVRCELATPQGIVEVLDTAVLMARCPESCISLGGHVEAARGEPATSPHTYLVFEAGGLYASRIDGVQEIIALPETLRERIEGGLAVSLPWRGHAVPVCGLFDRRAPAPGEARLLVVVVAGARRVAIPIAGVKAMIAPRTATLARLRVRGELVEVVSTAASAPERASFEVVDLAARAGARQALPQPA